MSKLLHIKASPREDESFSTRVAQAFVEAFTASHHDYTIETLDLFTAELPAFEAPQAAAKYSVLAGQEPAGPAAKAWKAVIDVIQHFKSGDFVVISSPMWNFSIPYRLKQYIDIIVQPSLTFSYEPEKGYTGLVTGRPAVLVLARGGSYSPPSQAEAYDMQKPYLEAILRFIGFTDIRTLIVEPTMVSQEEAAKVLTAARAKAVELASTF